MKSTQSCGFFVVFFLRVDFLVIFGHFLGGGPLYQRLIKLFRYEKQDALGRPCGENLSVSKCFLAISPFQKTRVFWGPKNTCMCFLHIHCIYVFITYTQCMLYITMFIHDKHYVYIYMYTSWMMYV